MGVVAVACTVAMVVGVGPAIQGFAERTVGDRLQTACTGSERYVESRFRLLQSMVGSVATAADVRSILRADDVETAKVRVAQSRSVLAVDLVMLVGARGDILASAPGLTEIGELPVGIPWVREPLAGRRYVGVFPTVESVFLIATTPVTEGERILGAVVVGEELDSAFAAELRESLGSGVTFVNRGQAVAWSIAEASEREGARLAGELAKAFAATAEVHRVEISGSDRFVVARRIGTGTHLVLSRSAKDLADLQQKLWSWVLWVGGLAMALAMLLSHFISRRLSSPLRDLATAADRVADGDLTTEVGESSMEETARLGRAFNRMTHRVRQLVDDARLKAQILQRQRNELEWANQTKSNFLITASHELRTPITNIVSSSEILSRHGADDDEETRREFLNMIEVEAARISTLVDQLLDVTSLESGMIQMNFSEIDIREIVSTAYEEFRVGIGSGRATTLQFSGDLDRCVGDHQRLAQVVEQLLDNAVRFTPSGSPIALHLRATDRGLDLLVADRGPGFASAEERERIFQRFVQGGDILTEKPSGVGLGLSIARDIARAHAGELRCEDNPGGGAVMILSLPTRIVVESEAQRIGS